MPGWVPAPLTLEFFLPFVNCGSPQSQGLNDTCHLIFTSGAAYGLSGAEGGWQVFTTWCPTVTFTLVCPTMQTLWNYPDTQTPHGQSILTASVTCGWLPYSCPLCSYPPARLPQLPTSAATLACHLSQRV